MTKGLQSIKAAVRKADPAVREWIRELEKRNGRLHRQLVTLEADILELKNAIKALKNERGKKLTVQIHTYGASPEIIAKIREMEDRYNVPEAERISVRTNEPVR